MLFAGYVLMQRIFPEIEKTAFLRNGKVEILHSISEIGIYGVFLSDNTNSNTNTNANNSNIDNNNNNSHHDDDNANDSSPENSAALPIMNAVAGYLVRTKPAGIDEGGVATGYSVLSSLILYDH